MWTKQKDEAGIAPQAEPMRASSPQTTAPPASLPAHANVRPPVSIAAIGPSMLIKGEIRSREELLVDGDVEGLMESESLLTVGANGKVKANIKARDVVIFGTVRGDVEVTGKIAIREQGSLIGNIKCSGISIDDGAYFKGSIDITRGDTRAPAKSAAIEPKVAVQAG